MRARNIKPGFFENETLAELKPLERLLYIGLWCYADREGRFEWRPKRIKAVILPYDDCDIESMLMSLHAMTFIDMYDTPKGKVGFIPKFKEHQKPHPHEAKSVLPEKSKENQCHDMALQCNEMSPKCSADSLIPDIIYKEPPISPKGEDDEQESLPPVSNGRGASPRGDKNSGYSDEFEKAWRAYPRHDGKRNAYRAWIAAIKRGMPVADMVGHIQSRSLEPDWEKEGGRFIPHFSTWINRDGWLNDGARLVAAVRDDEEIIYGLDFYGDDGPPPPHLNPAFAKKVS